MEIRDSKFVITGGANGIGEEMSFFLAKAGGQVCVLDIDRSALSKIEKSSKSGGYAIETYSCDIREEEQVTKSIADFSEKKGGIDCLVNNAAVLLDGMLVSVMGGKVKKYSTGDWDNTIATNLRGTFLCTREVVADMISRRKGGLVVNIGSLAAVGNRGQTSYSSSKAGVDALVVTWAQELAPFGIRVVGIAPGIVETDMPLENIPDPQMKKWVRKTPLKRLGKTSEVAKAVEFCITDEFFNGRILHLDGGLRM